MKMIVLFFLNLDMALKNSTPWKFQIHFLSIFFPAITIVVAYTMGIRFLETAHLISLQRTL